MKHPRILPFFLLLITFCGGCELFDNDVNEGEDEFSIPGPVYPQPYAQPSVSPDGTKLLFVRNKITRLDRQGGHLTDPDSSGIWVADIDGRNMKLLIQSQNVGSPTFSPDMKWVLFEGGAQIYKVPFAGDSVVMDSLIQLTSEGRNFFPDWSPDGEWIAYSNTIGDTVGIWISPTNGSSEKYYFTYGAEPDWLIDGNQILYGNQGLWIEKIDHSDKMQLFEGSNKVIRNIEANEIEKRITFSSNESNDITLLQVFTIDFDGSNLEKITSNGGVEPSWNYDSEIIYVQFNPHSYTKNNGTIWIMNADGSQKQQLTFNHGLELE